MKKKLVLVLFLLVCIQHYGQDYTTSFDIKLTKKSVAFSYVDKQNDEAYLLVGNTKVVKCSHYGSNFEIKDSMTVMRPEKEFTSIAGVNKTDNLMSVFWINEDHNQLYQQHLNFKDRTASYAKKHSFDFSNQKVIQTFSANNSFNLLTINVNSSILNLYTFHSNGTETTNKIDLQNQAFSNSKGKNTTLYDVLKEKINGFDSAFETPIIDNDALNSLTITAKKRKFFQVENTLYLTLDSNKQYTQIIKIDLTDYRFSIQKITHRIDSNDAFSNTNSLLVGHVIYQIASNNQKTIFSISELDGTLKKEFVSDTNSGFDYSNSAIVESSVNPTYKKNKIKSSGQFVSKMSDLNFGLSYYKFRGKNLITIGGVSEHIKKIQTSSDGNQDMFVYFGQFGLLGSLVYVVLFHQTNTNYDFGRDFTYFYTYLDENFNKQEDEIPYTSFDLIKNFFTVNPSALYPTVISLKSGNYLGYYKDESKKYTLLSYEK